MDQERPVIICDDKQTVVFGHTKETANSILDADRVTLRDARIALFWSEETHGVLGLATRGPQRGSRISPRVAELTIRGIIAVIEVSPQAREAWESEPWTS